MQAKKKKLQGKILPFHSVFSMNYSSHKSELIERKADIWSITPGGQLTEKLN